MKSQLKMGVYLSYISIFLTNITNIVLTPFIINNIGQSQYGLYMLIGALVGYIAVLDFGLGNTTVRYVAKYRAENNKKKEENFLFLTFLLYFVLSIITIIIGIIVYLNFNNIFSASLTNEEIRIAKVMFIILVLNFAITLPLKSFTAIVNAYERFIVPRLLTIGRIVLRALLVIILLNMGYKAIAIVMIDAILNIIIMIITMAYTFLKLKVKIKLHHFNRMIIKEILSYSSLIFVSVIVDQLYWRIGHLIVGIIASASDVAVFAIGMTFGQYFITFSTAISGVFLPKITRMITNNASNEELTDILIRTGRIQFIVLGLALTGFILLGNKFIFLWVGVSFQQAWIIAILVICPLTIVLTQTIGISILQAKNRHGFRALMLLGISILNVILSIFLTRKYGIIGASLGTTLSLLIGNLIILNLYYNYKIGLNMLRFFKEVLPRLSLAMTIAITIGSITLLISNESWLTFVLQSVVYTIIYITILWFTGMNIYEKSLFKEEFGKIKKILLMSK